MFYNHSAQKTNWAFLYRATGRSCNTDTPESKELNLLVQSEFLLKNLTAGWCSWACPPPPPKLAI